MRFFFLPHILRELKFPGQDIGREYAYNLSFPIKTSLGVGMQDPSFEE